jgi:hypothetical protein
LLQLVTILAKQGQNVSNVTDHRPGLAWVGVSGLGY